MYIVRAIWEGQVLDNATFAGEEEPAAEAYFAALERLAKDMKLESGTTIQFIQGDDVLYESYVA